MWLGDTAHGIDRPEIMHEPLGVVSLDRQRGRKMLDFEILSTEIDMTLAVD